MLYQDVRQAVRRMDRIHAPLRQAILADSTPQMAEWGTQAQTALNQLLGLLEEALQSNIDSPETLTSEGQVERVLVQAAVSALQRAGTQAQRLFLGTDVSSVRAGLLDFKTQADFADAYLRAAIGDLET